MQHTIIQRSVDPEPHDLLEELVGQFYPHLAEARIVLLWRWGLKPDKDGRLVLGRCKKASDLDHALAEYDFAIMLNHGAWAALNDRQRRALVDHELMHAAVSYDKNGDVERDEDGRPKWRIRKHDLEEFRDIVERHGCYKGDIEDFVRAAAGNRAPSLFSGLDEGDDESDREVG
jgi:hypothetical protein